MQAIASLAEAMPEELEVPGSIPALSGVTLGTIEPGSRLYGHAEGAVVLAVKGDSRAAGAGLRPGDVIVSVNQKPVMSPREVVDAAGEVKGTLLLQVIRDGSGLFIAVG
jgi:serine protease Do